MTSEDEDNQHSTTGGNQHKISSSPSVVSTSYNETDSVEDAYNNDGGASTGDADSKAVPADVRKMRRIMANRRSARESRERRKKLLTDLRESVEKLTSENATLAERNAALRRQLTALLEGVGIKVSSLEAVLPDLLSQSKSPASSDSGKMAGDDTEYAAAPAADNNRPVAASGNDSSSMMQLPPGINQLIGQLRKLEESKEKKASNNVNNAVPGNPSEQMQSQSQQQLQPQQQPQQQLQPQQQPTPHSMPPPGQSQSDPQSQSQMQSQMPVPLHALGNLLQQRGVDASSLERLLPSVLNQMPSVVAAASAPPGTDGGFQTRGNTASIQASSTASAPAPVAMQGSSATVSNNGNNLSSAPLDIYQLFSQIGELQKNSS